MLQVIDYQENENYVSVGFKKYNFVVYGQIGRIKDYTKEQHLQKLYEQCKSAIDYETKLYEEGKPNSIVVDKDGEEFIPEESKIRTLKLNINKAYIQFQEGQENTIVELSTIVKDQYDNDIDVEITYLTSLGIIEGDVLTIPKVTECTKVIITASAGDVSDNKTMYVYPYVEPEPSEIDILKERLDSTENALIDLLMEV